MTGPEAAADAPDAPDAPAAVGCGGDPRPGLTSRDGAWAGLRVLVAGLGVSGFAAADALLQRGARVRGVDSGTRAGLHERCRVLDLLGAELDLGAPAADLLADPRRLLDGVDLVVTSPGWRPTHPLFAAAAERGIPVWGEVELAWRLRPAQGAAPWLTVTGTNGKTTTVQMLASILTAAGLRACSAGNVGTPILHAVLDPDPFDVIAVELSSFQLHWQRSVSPLAAACLNVAPDHVDWHGSFDAYRAAKGRVYANTQVACVYNAEDPLTERLVREADVVDGCRAVGFTTGVPGPGMVGVVDGVLADRAFAAATPAAAASSAAAATSASFAAELGTVADLRRGSSEPAPHVVANALAAAALARAAGVSAGAVAAGLRAFTPEAHRIAEVATAGGVTWVDDSKATNPHAAAASLAAYDRVVWVAGGLLKGADVDGLVAAHAGRLAGVVLLGADRARIADALARHAPHVPVVDVAATDTGAMDLVVAHAGDLSSPGDVVLLAPAAASMDMFANYEARGDAFADAVRRRLRPAGETGGAR